MPKIDFNTSMAVSIKQRSSFLDKALLQALIYSLLFHLVLFGTFRIRLNDFQDSAIQMQPLNVAIDSEGDEPKTSANVVDTNTIDNSSLFTANLDEDEYRALNMARLRLPVSQPLATSPSMPDTLTAFTDKDIHDLTGEFTWVPNMYPLQLKLSSGLKALTLLEDGSCLFKEKGPHDDLGRFVLAANHLSIEYSVLVDGATGKIERAKRSSVLLDRELQACADRLIKHVSFEPFSQKSILGSIELVFCCTGDEIKSLMHD